MGRAHHSPKGSCPHPRLRFLALTLLTPAFLGCGESAQPAPGPPLVYMRLAVDLLQDPPRWQSESHVPGHPPRVQVACPSRDQVSDSGDQLALILPPPASVTFRVSEDDGPVFLRTSLGVDLAMAQIGRAHV